MQSKDEIRAVLEKWNRAWNEHDLEGVMGLFHEDILFNNWTGGRVQNLKKLYPVTGPKIEQMVILPAPNPVLPFIFSLNRPYASLLSFSTHFFS